MKRIMIIAIVLTVACTDDSPPSVTTDVKLTYRDTAQARDAIVVSVADAAPRVVDASPFACPPSDRLERIDTEPCERNNLSPGRRIVWCDKGRIRRGPCEPCSIELCDGEDNDCDESIDEGIFSCDTACGPGTGSCEGGSILGCTAPPVSEEICDFLDNDCDGSIDECLVRHCYTGPPDTANVGACRPGLQTCQAGDWGGDSSGEWLPDACDGETHPSEEVCDGADNDCDGIVDQGIPIRNTDILFVVDWSSSMGARIDATLEALARFSRQFQASEQIRWGLIVGPVRLAHEDVPGAYQETLIFASNISAFQEFLERFREVTRIHNGGMEMLLDAVYLALRNVSGNLPNNLDESRWEPGVRSIPPLANFVVDWRQEADKIIIVFSDEVERTYMLPPNTIYRVDDALNATQNLKLFSFAGGFYGWDDLAVHSGGRNFALTHDADEMFESLMTILDDVCRPRL